MSKRKKIISVDDYCNDMQTFLTSCHVDISTAKQLINNNMDVIQHMLSATPELIARKLYERESGTSL